MGRGISDFSIAAAVNDRQILAGCLERSPDVVSGALNLKTYEGYASASAALNAGLDGCAAEIIILAHQDVYLPRGWLASLISRIDELERDHPNWAVLGLYGRKPLGDEVGLVWSSGLGRLVGQGGFGVAEAVTLDELVLIVRRASGLRFDEDIPGFHLYGTDIVMQGRAQNLPSFVIEAPAIHNSRPVRTLTGAYARAYRYMQRKWRKSLPLKNLSTDVVWHPLLLWRVQWRSVRIYKRNVLRPKRDAVEIARSLNYE